MRRDLDDTTRAALHQLGCSCDDPYVTIGEGAVIAGALHLPLVVRHDETCALLERQRRVTAAPFN